MNSNKKKEAKISQHSNFAEEADKIESCILGTHQVVLRNRALLFRDGSNLQALIQQNKDCQSEISAKKEALKFLDEMGSEMIRRKHYASDAIRKRVVEIYGLWNRLQELIKQNELMYERALQLEPFFQSIDEMLAGVREVNQHPENVERRHDYCQRAESRLNFLRLQTQDLVRADVPNLDDVIAKMQLNICQVPEWAKAKSTSGMPPKKNYKKEVKNFLKSIVMYVAYVLSIVASVVKLSE